MATGNRENYPNVDQEKGKCLEFLRESPQYGIQLQEIANRERRCLDIFMDELINFKNDMEFVENVKHNTQRYIQYFEDAVDNLLPARSVNNNRNQDVFDILEDQRAVQFNLGQDGNPSQQDLKIRRFEVQLIPSVSEEPRSLREIHATEIGHLLKIKGMVVRVTDVKPCVTLCTYSCDVCGGEIFQHVTGSQFMPIIKCPSPRCIDNKSNGRIQMVNRGSVFVKYQEVRIQELPESVPVGNIPRSMSVHCWGETTRQCVPGDIVIISGIFLSVRLQGFKAMKTGLQTETYLKASKIDRQQPGFTEMTREVDMKNLVREIALDPDTYRRLACSIAPEIFGHEDVKKALLLQLVSADTKVMADGMKIRGDINILLMGDPGIAKSQLLKYIAGISPRGVYTTGKGSSGVGLTAAVVRDEMSGEMALEGGALVLADCGICCIDEFDKMEESDRTAIHEVMEQQTISIAKAGITTTLNARAAVLAAANPLYGRYNRRKSISENVDLPNSLLSRFDLLFLMLDKADTEQDMALSKHVLHVHKYSKNSEINFKPFPRASIIQYIALARTIKPKVPPELSNYIVEAYISLRTQASYGPTVIKNKQNDQTIMTARQLLSILRLSQALARLRLSNVISTEDIDEAIRLMHSSKSSLAAMENNNSEDPVSSIFTSIKSMYEVSQTNVLPFSHVETAILKKGFTTAQLQLCLQDYEQLGVIQISNDKSQIFFEV